MILRNRLFSVEIKFSDITVFFALSICAMVALYVSLAIGKSLLSVSEVWNALWGEGKAFTQLVVTKLRMPRTIVGFMAGGMLAVAGYFMQIATKNPIASPTLTGVADGAAVGAVFFLAVFSDTQGNMHADYTYVPLFSLASASLALALVLGLHRLMKGGTPSFILIAITVAIVCKAFVSLLMMLSPIYRASQAAVWLSGSVDAASLSHAFYIAPFFIAVIVCIMCSGRIVRVMALSDNSVRAVGGNNARNKMLLMSIAGVATALAVSFTGPISFIGILAPHIMYRISPRSFGVLRGMNIMLMGGIVVVSADTIGRTAFSPLQIPVGIASAVIGGIFFFILFHKKTVLS